MRPMVKGIAVVAAVAALGLASLGTALAQTATPPAPTPAPTAAMEKHHAFVGTIKSITGSSFVLMTKKGEVTIDTNAQTKFKVPDVKNATLANFKVGDRVNVMTEEMNGKNVATHVHLVPGKPAHVHRVGTISAWEPGKSITIKTKKGETSTFVVTADTKIHFKRGATEVKVGERATVIARREPGKDQFTAKAILVFGERGGGHAGGNK